MLKSLRVLSKQVSRFSLAQKFQRPWEFRDNKWINVSASKASKKFAHITFVLPDKNEISVEAEIGQTFLDIVLDHSVDVDGFGACEGTLSCSTCHLVFSPEDFERIGTEQRKITDDEEDMLDLALGRTDESRLGCQVKVAEWMDGHKIIVPASSDARLG